MEEQAKVINDLLTSTFDSILRIEEKTINSRLTEGLTIAELHAIAAIGAHEQKTMTEVARRVNVTLATLTSTMNRLVKKGYVERVRNEKDRRQVLVRLTGKGRKACRAHEAFHRKMVDDALDGMTEEEVAIFARGVGRVKDFFDRQNAATLKSAGTAKTKTESIVSPPAEGSANAR